MKVKGDRPEAPWLGRSQSHPPWRALPLIKGFASAMPCLRHGKAWQGMARHDKAWLWQSQCRVLCRRAWIGSAPLPFLWERWETPRRCRRSLWRGMGQGGVTSGPCSVSIRSRPPSRRGPNRLDGRSNRSEIRFHQGRPPQSLQRLISSQWACHQLEDVA
jgi:hypothetical protein